MVKILAIFHSYVRFFPDIFMLRKYAMIGGKYIVKKKKQIPNKK